MLESAQPRNRYWFARFAEMETGVHDTADQHRPCHRQAAPQRVENAATEKSFFDDGDRDGRGEIAGNIVIPTGKRAEQNRAKSERQGTGTKTPSGLPPPSRRALVAEFR